ncbi:short chain dehydrogenase [Streptomyces echinoruber]|uniref:Short chain dehydrogenase n=2 Tax=Streptomyces echinoruber TaxID=68898 RepID=A0A918RYH2_9ACTN|nr:short chain dehydrogenase [Streptomyces echinoruber]
MVEPMVENARERWVRSGGVELCVAELGDASRPTVVLVHGYPDSKEVWSRVAARLADRFHVVLYDVRGHGRSTAPRPLRGNFTLERLTDDFLAVADAVSPGRPVHLVGHDWGSVQGWEFVTAERTRGRIASFTSLSGPSLDHLGHWLRERAHRPTPRHVAQLLGQGARSWYVYALHTPLLPELAWRGPLGRAWPALLRRAEKLPADGYPTPSLPRDAAHGAWLYRDNIRARVRAPRPDPRAHAPVQLVTPLKDAFLSERLYDGLERWVPRLVRRTLPVRHWAPRTRPDQLAAWITDFVTATESAEPAASTESTESTESAESIESTESAESAEAAGGGRPPVTASGPYADRFGGQLVLVTGAGGGIGRATACAFAAAGARVVAVDLDGAAAAGTARLCRAAGAPAAWAETADVADERAMEKLAGKVAARYGVVDVLVNNAGIGLAGAFLDTTPQDWRRVLDVNLWGVIHGCRLFGRQMAERGQGGHIVTVASAAAYQPSRLLPAYTASKAAVLALSDCLRAELAGRGIGVTTICPGFVDTGITATARFTGVDPQEEQRLRRRTARLYGLRNYPPEKVAAAILRAVARGEAVVPVTVEARFFRALSRLAPGATRALARVRPRL